MYLHSPEQSGKTTLCLRPWASTTTPSLALMSTDLTWPSAAWVIIVEKSQSLWFWLFWIEVHVDQKIRPRTTINAKLKTLGRVKRLNIRSPRGLIECLG